MKQILVFLFSLIGFSNIAQKTDFVGIGAKLEIDSTTLGYKVLKINGFVVGGVAENSGLKVGDLILKVNNQNAFMIPMENVVKMIKGEAGTTVKIEVNRQGTVKTFSMVRKKIDVPIQYGSKINSEFCNALTKLLNDAPYQFRNIIDTISSTTNDQFRCKVNFPSFEKVLISKSYGSNACTVTVGSFKTEDEVNAAGEKTLAQIKECFPQFSYSIFNDGDWEIIEAMLQNDKSFTNAIFSMYANLDKKDNLYHLEIKIEGGDLRLFMTNTLTPQNNDFANALRTIYGDVENKFKNIKSTQHESDDLFNPTYWYDINLKIPGAADCYVDNGSLTSFTPPKCIANFFLGEKELGKETLMKFSEIIIKSLGSDFVYSPSEPRQLIAKSIPSSSEEVYTFVRKTRKSEEYVPVMSLVFNKEIDGRYRIYLSFYKAIF